MKDDTELLQIVQAKPHIISRKEKNCYLLVNRENGAVLVVNELGVEIWNIIKEKIKLMELIKKLAKKYDVTFADSKREATKFIEELFKNEFVVISNS